MEPSTVPTIENANELDRTLSKFISKDDKIALLLDYDGTLAPLVAHPRLSVMDSDSEKYLNSLLGQPSVFIAMISGRGSHDLRQKVAMDGVTYAGNHGFEIVYPDGKKYEHQVSDEIKQNYAKLVSVLENDLSKNGAWLENKNLSLTFHYREVPVDLHETLSDQVKAIIRSYGFIENQAHMAVEAKPRVQWNKGEAAIHILREKFGIDWHTKVKAIFAGDDTTDEDAMKALKGKGLSFRIANSSDIKTFADYRLPSTKTVALLLEWIARNR